MKTYIIDSFTSEYFKGNPAAVCLLESELDEWYMSSITKELGLSETAFLVPSKMGEFFIRFFSPKMEISLCGHATLAAAHAIFTEHTDMKNLILTNKDGLILKVSNNCGLIKMHFPIYRTEPFQLSGGLLNALGIAETKEVRYNKQLKVILIEIYCDETLRNLKPDFRALIRSYAGINGVVVTSISNDLRYDYALRYFWPWSGTNEDPVTGGIQTFLAKYWADKLNKPQLVSFQCSERTGTMNLLVKDDKLEIRAEAVTVLEGHLTLNPR